MRGKKARALRKKIQPPGRGREIQYVRGQASASAARRLYQAAKKKRGLSRRLSGRGA